MAPEVHHRPVFGENILEKRIHGVVAAVATPLQEDFAPDVARLIRHCRSLLEEGCDGINLLGTTGEATAFSMEQRLAVMRSVASSGLPLDRFMVGTGVCALSETVQLTRAACELGFAGALLLPPFFYPDPSNDGLVAYVSEVVRRVSHPGLRLYLYHIPQNSGIPWHRDVFRQLKLRHPGELAGLKDSSGVAGYAQDAALLADFDVFPSSEAWLADARASGFAGCISATVNLTANVAQEAWSRSGTTEGLAAARKASDLRNLFTRYSLVSAVKAALATRYRDETWARVSLPALPLEFDSRTVLYEAFATRLSAA
jgi:4-hydroxy-tetrahydrodipicolinate synthase